MAEQPVQDDFTLAAAPFRGELLAHCYRMTGSMHDAEDLVQETYLRAWQAYDRFQGRSSLRTWLYRIATNACLTALDGRRRRPLPADLSAPGDGAAHLPAARPEIGWLEPFPDALLDGAPGGDPAAVVLARESVRLAFVAALQHLPPRQRAVLLLREVMQWRAAEVAEVLDTTPVAVNSILQRARSQLDRAAPAERDTTDEQGSAGDRELLDRYVTAFERKDIPALVELFTADAVWEMPPHETWYQGPEHIGRHLLAHCPAGPGDQRLVPVRAGGRPAFAGYLRTGGSPFRAFNLQVLTLAGGRVARAVNFLDPRLFRWFGLPETLDAPAAAAPERPRPAG
ncbi:RNA polymerase sigma factor [Sphaerisporangium rufum]|uniref:RNA polymerase sigma factor n=1 Tax=Sphaerisporangium rufum TaxID=1381558 RepID=A0A919R699_9ACTN|nr:sigma-70 family RNA polymerase sigma factor [Sphaerisporangium rufum]GII80284.1 RNA polymerase sigma factor [Sphaerisporangium rufum]